MGSRKHLALGDLLREFLDHASSNNQQPALIVQLGTIK